MSSGIKLRKIYRVGYCLSRGALGERSLGWEKMRFYARAFLLEHPQKGLILIDTGYGDAAIHSLKKGINRLYGALLPVTYSPEDRLLLQLAQDGIAKSDLSYLILTHFHPDHIGALPEFTKTRFVYRKEALDSLLKMARLSQLFKGFLPDLIPAIPENSRPILESAFQSHWNGFPACDLFSDGSLFLVDLPGHALGQMGVAIQDKLFAADSQWSSGKPPHPLSFWLQEDPKAYRRTWKALKELPPSIQIIPTHTICPHA